MNNFRIIILGLLGFLALSNVSIAQTCSEVEGLFNQYRSTVLSYLDSSAREINIRISKRKSLVVRGFEDMSFSGCNMTARLRVTLKRKIRRDAHGIVSVSGVLNPSSFNLNNLQSLCFSNLRVNSFRLSNTLRVGESFYAFIANRVFSNQGCSLNILG